MYWTEPVSYMHSCSGGCICKISELESYVCEVCVVCDLVSVLRYCSHLEVFCCIWIISNLIYPLWSQVGHCNPYKSTRRCLCVHTVCKHYAIPLTAPSLHSLLPRSTHCSLTPLTAPSLHSPLPHSTHRSLTPLTTPSLHSLLPHPVGTPLPGNTW